MSEIRQDPTTKEWVIIATERRKRSLTVSEAMWKGAPAIGGNVGGIRYQIDDGINGFLISSVEETAQRIAQLLKTRNYVRLWDNGQWKKLGGIFY